MLSRNLGATQLEIDLWEVIHTSSQAPETANLPMVFDLLDLALLDLDTRSQLQVVGKAIAQIADLFYDRSSLFLAELHSRSQGEPVIADADFERYLHKHIDLDLEQFMQSLSRPPRQLSEQDDLDSSPDSTAGEISKDLLLQTLEQEQWLNEGVNEGIEDAAQVQASIQDQILTIAHTEDISHWIQAIALCLEQQQAAIGLTDLQKQLKLPLVEIWMGLLLGNFHIQQTQGFYDRSGIQIARIKR